MTPANAIPLLEASLAIESALRQAAESIDHTRPFSTGAIIEAYYRHCRSAPRPQGNRLLTSDHDEAPVGVVQVFSVNNFSVSSSQIADVVKRRWGMDPGKQRVGRWVERCDEELGWRTCRPLSDHRTGALVV